MTVNVSPLHAQPGVNDQPEPATGNPVLDAIYSRRSVRGFLPTPVPRDVVNQIIQAAGQAPSGNNVQPWHVHVITGNTLATLAKELHQAHDTGVENTREYEYYPTVWRTPYKERRRENGWGLYGTLGIGKGDAEKMKAQHGRNFLFFDAPVVLMFTIDRDLQQGSWLDYGMFLQTIMIAARSFGLHTCPQAAVSNYPAIVKRHIGVGDDQVLICCVSMGYEDPNEPANAFRATRLPLDQFVQYHE
ncbi:MAG: nitroreductase [Burkholderiaceae bacterium]